MALGCEPQLDRQNLGMIITSFNCGQKNVILSFIILPFIGQITIRLSITWMTMYYLTRQRRRNFFNSFRW